MKLKYVIGTLVVVACLALMFFFAREFGTQYVSVKEAVASGERVQVIGVALKGTKEVGRESGSSSFELKDENGDSFKVVTDNSLPTNFDHATQIVVKGSYNKEAGCFEADEILTKCPSKYEKKAEEETSTEPEKQ